MSTVGDAQPIVLTAPASPAALSAAAAPATAPSMATAFTAGDVWRVIKQRKLLIAVTFVVLYLLVGAATALVYRFAPQYVSEAYVKLIPPMQSNYSEQILPRDYILHSLSTEAARFRDPALLMDVLKRPEIKGTTYYKWFGDNFEECLKDFRDRLSVTPVRDSYLIRVAIGLKDKTEATNIVNTLVQQAVSKSQFRLTEEGKDRLNSLKNRRADKEKQLTATRDRIASARQRRDMPALESDREVQSEMIAMLNNTSAELRTRAADVQAQLDSVHGRDYRTLPLSAEMKVIVESDPVLRYYRQQVETLDVQIEAARRTVGENHRSMEVMRQQRESYARLEAARREELIDDLKSRQMESLSQEQARVRNMQAEIGEQLAQREATLKDLDQTIQDLKGLEEDEKLLQGELEAIGKSVLEVEGQVGVTEKEGKLQIAIAARDAVSPSRPEFVTWLGGGGVLCLLVAVGLAFLREVTDQAIRTPVDVARHGGLSVLGSVPLLDEEEETDIAELEQVTRRAPQSLIAESFRQIRAHLAYSGPLASQRTLLITSPRPEDGKTAVAINLAVTFAQSNQRVLLVDANFRRPGVRRAFAGTRAEGLCNVLVGQMALDQAIVHTELPNLDVLGSGPLPPNPGELLGSPQMRELLKLVAGKYDRVVVDGPPCLLVSDALVIATQVDAVVLVARAVHGTKGTLRRAREQLQRIGARVIGAVLNGVRAQPGGYFKQQYREFYEYREEEATAPRLPADQPAALERGPADDDRQT